MNNLKSIKGWFCDFVLFVSVLNTRTRLQINIYHSDTNLKNNCLRLLEAAPVLFIFTVPTFTSKFMRKVEIYITNTLLVYDYNYKINLYNSEFLMLNNI